MHIGSLSFMGTYPIRSTLISGTVSVITQIAQRLFIGLSLILVGATAWALLEDRWRMRAQATSEQMPNEIPIVVHNHKEVLPETAPPTGKVSSQRGWALLREKIRTSKWSLFGAKPKEKGEERSQSVTLAVEPEMRKTIRGLMDSLHTQGYWDLFWRRTELKTVGQTIRTSVHPIVFLNELYLWNREAPAGRMRMILDDVCKSSFFLSNLVEDLQKYQQNSNFIEHVNILVSETELNEDVKRDFLMQGKSTTEQKRQVEKVLTLLFPAGKKS